MNLKHHEREAAWSAGLALMSKDMPAISHKTAWGSIVFFKRYPFTGKLVKYGRKQDGKVRLALHRTGRKKMASDWHSTMEEAFENIRSKAIRLNMDEPVSHTVCVQEGVQAIHQIYGLYRDGKRMSKLFKRSAAAWEAYAKREQCKYSLWTADEVDTLMQLEAPDWVLKLYTDVRFAVQRASVARYFMIYQLGGLYADLDTFPNLDRFPKVPLGMC